MSAVLADAQGIWRPRWSAACLLLLTGLLLAVAVDSLDWRIEHDPPLLMYQGFLMDRLGLVPYRDFWDNNPPGTQLFHYFVGRTIGYGDRALRWLDLGMLAVTLAATVRAVGVLHPGAGWCAAVVWGLVYVGPGPGFQRDDVVLTLTSVALLVALSRGHAALRCFWLGLLSGLAGTIKPPALIILPVVVAFVATAERSSSETLPRRLARLLGWAAAGALLPFLGIVFYLVRNEALEPFLEMARGYWPLYTRLSGGLGTITSPAFNLYSGYRKFGRIEAWLLPAFLGILVAWRASRGDAARRRALWLLVGLAAAFFVYVGIQGKFFPYHWHPFLYFLIVLSSLSFMSLRDQSLGALRPLPVLVLLGFLFFRLDLPRVARTQLAGGAVRGAPKLGRSDEIAEFLKANLKAGDAVQPLDWTGGVVHAMLIAEAAPATPFLYDFPFYHHVSDPYVFELRGRFLDAIRRARPRYVIEVPGEEKPWVRGKDTTRDFNKLRRLLEARYSEVVRQNGYVIYERRRDPNDEG